MKAQPGHHRRARVEWEWNAETFATQLAGGTLPTTFRVPFTDAKGLAERKQIADVTKYVNALPYAKEFNPSVLAAAQGTDGKIYGLPTDVYGVGPALQPRPVRAGRARPRQAADHLGRGARRRQGDRRQDRPGRLRPDEQEQHRRLDADHAHLHARWPDGVRRRHRRPRSTTTPPSEGLQMLHDMRWDDDSMGRNTNFEWGTINEAFAAGKVGMYMSAARTSTTRWSRRTRSSRTSYGLGRAAAVGLSPTPASSVAAPSPRSAPRRSAQEQDAAVLVERLLPRCEELRPGRRRGGREDAHRGASSRSARRRCRSSTRPPGRAYRTRSSRTSTSRRTR